MTAKIKSLARHGEPYKNKPRGVSDRAFAKVYWPYIPLLIVTGLMLSFGAQTGTLQAATRHPASKVLDYSTSMTISGLLADTNSARAGNGVGGLSLNSKLNAAAQAQANDMAARNYWSHNTPEGSPPWVWVTNQGYSYQKLGQNLAAGFSDEQATINGWLASPPHRENLLDPAYSEVGFGSANNPDYTSAGGGPMTIVVAFYGQPTASTPAPVAAVPASTTPAAPTSSNSRQSTTPAPATASSPAPSATQPAESAAPTSSSQPVAETKSASKIQPTTTLSATPQVTLGIRTSRAQVAFAHVPQSNYATAFAIIGMTAAIGLWLSKHFLAFRRVFVYSEAFVVKHPLVDVGLLTIAAVSFLLSQTAGYII